MGKGVDRHLFALRSLAASNGMTTPAIFSDPGYTKFGANILSTSTLVSDALALGGFGPVHAEGFGVGYGVTDAAMRFTCTSYGQGASAFTDSLKSAILELRDVMTKK